MVLCSTRRHDRRYSLALAEGFPKPPPEDRGWSIQYSCGKDALVSEHDDQRANASSVPALVAGLGELPSILVGTDAVDEVVWETAMLAVRANSAVEDCGVTVLRDGRPHSLFPGSAPHSELEDYQYGLQDGPTIQAMTTRQAVRVTSTVDETRWGEYSGRAHASGVASSLTLPLIAGDQVLGAINYYSSQPDAFPADFVLEQLVADLASTGLWCLLKHADRQQMDDQLQQALTSRSDIDQAKGILMAQQRCGPDEAFDLLRRASQRSHVKLRDIAAQIVARARDDSA